MPELRSDVLESIRAAFDSHAPALSQHIVACLAGEPIKSGATRRRESIYPAYDVNLAPLKVSIVKDALLDIQAEFGPTKTFAGLQINYLIAEWARVHLP